MPNKKKAKLSFSYQRAGELRKYISEQGTILPRELTGLSAKDQKRMSREVKRARHLALMEFTQTL